jgi:hypothetical protein
VVQTTGYEHQNAASPGGATEWRRAISAAPAGARIQSSRRTGGLHHRLMSNVPSGQVAARTNSRDPTRSGRFEVEDFAKQIPKQSLATRRSAELDESEENPEYEYEAEYSSRFLIAMEKPKVDGREHEADRRSAVGRIGRGEAVLGSLEEKRAWIRGVYWNRSSLWGLPSVSNLQEVRSLDK